MGSYFEMNKKEVILPVSANLMPPRWKKKKNSTEEAAVGGRTLTWSRCVWKCRAALVWRLSVLKDGGSGGGGGSDSAGMRAGSGLSLREDSESLPVAPNFPPGFSSPELGLWTVCPTCVCPPLIQPGEPAVRSPEGGPRRQQLRFGPVRTRRRADLFSRSRLGSLLENMTGEPGSTGTVTRRRSGRAPRGAAWLLGFISLQGGNRTQLDLSNETRTSAVLGVELPFRTVHVQMKETTRFPALTILIN